MSIEELRLVLETIREVSSTAGTVGMVWVFLHYATTLVAAVVWPTCIGVVAVLVTRLFIGASKAPSGDEVEKTKRAQLEVDRDVCRVQLHQIAESSGAPFSRYSGITLDRHLTNIINHVKGINK